jgi:AP-3 complex subunit beta
LIHPIGSCYYFSLQALDPPFTRLIKIDILVSLALEPAAIEAVLNELRTYIRHGDKTFSASAIRAVGKVAELARVVYDRHGQIRQRSIHERQTANRIALDALYGLATVTQTSDSKVILGEAVTVIHNILLLLGSTRIVHSGETVAVEDPNNVQAFALRRILLLLVNSLLNRRRASLNDGNEGDEEEVADSALASLDLPPAAQASALWVVGEWLTSTPSLSTASWTSGGQDIAQVRRELVRLVDGSFSEHDPKTKEEALHFASKVWISIAMAQSLSPSLSGSTAEMAICEHILSMGRVDVNPDVKDRARFESSVLHATIGLKFDTEGMDERPGSIGMTIHNAKNILLANKPSPSYLRIEDDATVDMSSFRFGTLSSLVGHRARGAYLPLPNWANENSPSVLREPIEAAKEQLAPIFRDPSQMPREAYSGFYGDDGDRGKDTSDNADKSDTSSSSSGSSNSSSSEESDGQNADSESDSDSDDDSDDSDLKDDLRLPKSSANGTIQNHILLQPLVQQNAIPPIPAFQNHFSSQASSEDESSSSDDDDASDDENYGGDISSSNILNFSNNMRAEVKRPSDDANLLGMMTGSGIGPIPEVSQTSKSSVMDDLKGLVMAPIIVQDPKATEPDMGRDSSAWIQLVRPELCGGLSVEARYLRGPTKEHELQLMNISAWNPCIVCLQLRFGNK